MSHTASKSIAPDRVGEDREGLVTLVDSAGGDIGPCGKMAAHREPRLHRAFSLLVFNSRDELLLQKRARIKYHSGGLWSNTCCSHPSPGDVLSAVVHERLKSEMGFDCALHELFRFTYREYLGEGLYEHELDHVFAGRFDGSPIPDPDEVEDWKWISLSGLARDMASNPGSYTAWLRIIMERLSVMIPQGSGPCNTFSI